ncbi:hypothetical protein Droror1_Dr00023302 [Drosera rotundifolia]
MIITASSCFHRNNSSLAGCIPWKRTAGACVNLSWLAVAKAEAATMSMVGRAIPDASSLHEANEIVRGNWLRTIDQPHQQYSGNSTIRDILDVGCYVGVSTRFLADKFPSAQVTIHECPARATVNLVRETFRLLRPGGTIAITDNSPK